MESYNASIASLQDAGFAAEREVLSDGGFLKGWKWWRDLIIDGWGFNSGVNSGRKFNPFSYFQVERISLFDSLSKGSMGNGIEF